MLLHSSLRSSCVRLLLAVGTVDKVTQFTFFSYTTAVQLKSENNASAVLRVFVKQLLGEFMRMYEYLKSLRDILIQLFNLILLGYSQGKRLNKKI